MLKGPIGKMVLTVLGMVGEMELGFTWRSVQYAVAVR